MAFKAKVKELLDLALETRSDLFIIDFSISTDNKILVTIDGDQGVTLQDCIDVSRAIEHNLDSEEQEEYGLEVASAGATAHLKFLRQYNKNVGRKMKVVTTDKEKYEAFLEAVLSDSIVLTWKAREAKPVGKGKITVDKTIEIPFEKIKEASVIILF